jgi:hypothetical protein
MRAGNWFRHWWFKGGVIVIGALVISLVLNRLTGWSWSQGKPVTHENISLYGPGERDFRDKSSGLTFTLPEDFSVQALSLPLPEHDGAERMIMKLKRDWDGTPDGKMPAWMQVSVAKQPADKPLADLLKKKIPDNGNPKQVGNVEDLRIDGQLAARITFEMRYHNHDYVREVVAIRKAERVFFFRCEFLKEDKTRARDFMRDAVNTVHLFK